MSATAFGLPNPFVALPLVYVRRLALLFGLACKVVWRWCSWLGQVNASAAVLSTAAIAANAKMFMATAAQKLSCHRDE